MKVLVVCTGNTCRSPMAAGLLRTIGTKNGLNFEVRTAGLAHHPNKPVAQNAVAVMKELGVDISDEYSKPVTAEAVGWADIVLVVQRDHAAYLLEDYPSVEPKIRQLEKDVADPYCGPVAEYREVRDELTELLSRFIRSLGPE